MKLNNKLKVSILKKEETTKYVPVIPDIFIDDAAEPKQSSLFEKSVRS